MYKKVVIIASLSWTFIQARDTENRRRPITENSVISQEKVIHYINITGVPYAKELRVNGSWYLKDFRTEKLMIQGNAALENAIITYESYISNELAAHKSTFRGVMKVDGPVAASMSKFKDRLIVDGSALLISTTAQDIIVENSLGQQGHVYLQGRTIVNGSISFKSGIGKVYASPRVIIKGNVVGGTLYRQ